MVRTPRLPALDVCKIWSVLCNNALLCKQCNHQYHEQESQHCSSICTCKYCTKVVQYSINAIEKCQPPAPRMCHVETVQCQKADCCPYENPWHLNVRLDHTEQTRKQIEGLQGYQNQYYQDFWLFCIHRHGNTKLRFVFEYL